MIFKSFKYLLAQMICAGTEWRYNGGITANSKVYTPLSLILIYYSLILIKFQFCDSCVAMD